MTKEQFITILRKPATINLNQVKGLEDIAERFPYFQNAHLLLAKQYHGHENIRFENYLRKASAYASNRKMLYDLIKLETAEVIHVNEKQESSSEAIPFLSKNESPEIEHLHVVDKEDSVAQSEQPEQIKVPLIEIAGTASIELNESVTNTTVDPKEIIEQRLRELANEKDTTLIVPEAIENVPITPPTINVDSIPKKLILQAPVNLEEKFVTNQEKETDERLNQSGLQQKEQKEKSEQPHSFLEWLQVKSVPVIPQDRISEFHANEIIEKAPTKTEIEVNKIEDKLIENFIKSDPRIVASKSEFYSPGNMARLSAQDHQDLISETLARIYAQQGNLRKAIETYRKLALKSPEKSSYFAALIKDLEENDKKPNL